MALISLSNNCLLLINISLSKKNYFIHLLQGCLPQCNFMLYLLLGVFEFAYMHPTLGIHLSRQADYSEFMVGIVYLIRLVLLQLSDKVSVVTVI